MFAYYEYINRNILPNKKIYITWPAIRYHLLDRRLKFNEMKYFWCLSK